MRSHANILYLHTHAHTKRYMLLASLLIHSLRLLSPPFSCLHSSTISFIPLLPYIALTSPHSPRNITSYSSPLLLGYSRNLCLSSSFSPIILFFLYYLSPQSYCPFDILYPLAYPLNVLRPKPWPRILIRRNCPGLSP